MEVRCDKCQARYRVDDARIGPQGLTMRCGKCQNTFRVTRPASAGAVEAQAATPPGPPQAAPQPPPPANATMIFAAPTGTQKPPASASQPAAERSGQSALPAQPAPKPAAPRPSADDTAGRTMMFPSPAAAARKPPEPAAGGTVVFSQPPAAKAAGASRPPAKPGSDGAQSTLIFGGAPAPAQKPAAARAPVVKPGATKPPAEPAQSTMIFGASAALQGSRTIPAIPPAPAAPPQEAEAKAAEAQEQPAAEAEPPIPGAAAETDEAAGPPADVEEEAPAAPERKTSPFDKAPPRALLIGVAAGLVLLLAAGGGLLAYRKLARHPPPPPAVEMLASADVDAAQDTLASLASAEAKARDSLDLAGPRSRFPEATAALARIQIQWADALEDEAARLMEKNADDPRAARLQAEAKAKTKAAFELVSPAAKAEPRSPELQLALADYYRAQRSPSNMNRYLKPFKDDPRAALILGMAAAQELDGAEKAIPRLKAALAVEPRSARIHFRLALAHAAVKDEANARAEAAETLRLSPRHERAQVLLTELGPASAARPR